MSIAVVKTLKKYKIRPSKGLGQNFLTDEIILQKIIAAAELKPDDVVLEVGPGIGNLTIELAKGAKKVIAVEKDPKMVEILKEALKEFKNVEIIQGDIIKIFNFQFSIFNELSIFNYKVVANLPYYITSPVIRKFLELTETRPLLMVLMVQKEVAQRICAKPPDMTRSAISGSSRASRGMNLLAVSVQFYAFPKIVGYVSKNCFFPRPKVDSAIIKIIPKSSVKNRAAGEVKDEDEVFIAHRSRPNWSRPVLDQLFFRVVKAGFSQPRKQLLNNLSRLSFSKKNLSGKAKNPKLNREKVKSWLLENNIQPSQRAETLSVDDWLNLTKSFKIEK